MNDFRRFYLDLLLDGALLEISYLTLVTQNVSIQSFVDKWANVVVDTDTTFAEQIPLCDARFPDDIQTDLENNNDPAKLKGALDKRYPDKIIDILFFKGPNGFFAFRHSPKEANLFWKRHLDDNNKMLVVSELNGKPSWDKASSKFALEKCKQSISFEKDDPVEKILTHLISCSGLEYPVGTAVVYFEGDKFETKAVTLHPDSPVIELSIEDVKIGYCSELKLVCSFQKLPWPEPLHRKDVSYGKLRIFVYPNLGDDVNPSNFVTGGGERTVPDIWLAIGIIGGIIVFVFVPVISVCCKKRGKKCCS